jgi:glycosyltransferase involved in cell wall biosynthesis
MADHGSYERREERKPMRVALFSGNYNYIVDGASKALNRFVAYLENQGHEVLVFAPTARVPAFQHSGTLISVPSVPLPGNRKEFRLALGLPAAVRRKLDAFRPDIVHLSAPDWLGHEALNYARSKGVPAVASFHTRFDTYPRFYGARWLEPLVTDYLRRFYGRCVHVYAPAQSMVDELKRDGIGRDIRIWARGVDGALFNPKKRDLEWRRGLGFKDDDVVVLFVGRVVLEKSIDVFSNAVIAASTDNPKIRALVVGEGPERKRFMAQLPQGVFTGQLEGEKLARAYASADIFLNPSITETFGNVTLEAMASALPCVCAAASGSLSLVEQGRTGLLVSPEEGVSGYSAALNKLAMDQGLRRVLAAAGRAKAEGFAWPVILEGLTQSYREALASYASASADA